MEKNMQDTENKIQEVLRLLKELEIELEAEGSKIYEVEVLANSRSIDTDKAKPEKKKEKSRIDSFAKLMRKLTAATKDSAAFLVAATALVFAGKAFYASLIKSSFPVKLDFKSLVEEKKNMYLSRINSVEENLFVG